MQSPSNRGFTLIEVLIVIIIFAIGAAIAIPSIMDMGRRDQVKAEARQLKDQLARARATAIEDNAAVIVTFPNDSSYTIAGNVFNLRSSTIATTITKNPDAAPVITTFQWDRRGYPTQIAGKLGDIQEIDVAFTGANRSLNVRISSAGSITIN